MRWNSSKISGLLVLFLLGCSPTLTQRSARVDFGEAGDWPTFYRNNFQQLKSLESKARFTVESPGMSTNFQASVIFAAPDTLFLKAEGMFGVDIGEVFIGKHRYVFYNQFQNHFWSGSLDNPYENQFLQTHLKLSDLKHSVVGYVPLPTNLRLVDRKHGIFAARVEGEKWRFTVDLTTGQLQKWEIFKENRLVFREEFRNYRLIDGILFPGLIRILVPEEKEMVSVFHKNITVNRKIDPARYRIVIGPKVKQLMLGE